MVFKGYTKKVFKLTRRGSGTAGRILNSIKAINTITNKEEVCKIYHKKKFLFFSDKVPLYPLDDDLFPDLIMRLPGSSYNIHITSIPNNSYSEKLRYYQPKYIIMKCKNSDSELICDIHNEIIYRNSEIPTLHYIDLVESYLQDNTSVMNIECFF